MPRRKSPVPFGDYVRSLDLDRSIMTKGSSASEETIAIPQGFELSSLLARDMASDPTPDRVIETVTDFTNAMLEAAKPHT